MDIAYRAFCDQHGCLWSSDELYDSEADALAALAEHNNQHHPGQPVKGTAEESRP